jgi:hypothetical protein
MFKPGSIYRKFINDEFYNERHADFRNWYFNHFSKDDLEKIKNDFYDQLNETQKCITFTDWFFEYFLKNLKSEVNVLKERIFETSKGEKISSFFPPNRSNIILGENAEASAFAGLHKVDKELITLKDLNNIIRSQNFTNLFLIRLGDQYQALEEDIISLKSLFENHIFNQKKIFETFSIPIIKEEPMVQPPIKIEGFKSEDNTDEFIRILEQKIKNMNLGVLSKDITYSSSEDEVNNLEKMFSNLNISKEDSINPVYSQRSVDKHYYKRPSPQDLLYEENDNFQNSYSGKQIYEWNIDGLTEKQILDLIHKMIMYSTICKQQGNTDSMIASFIVVGFIGQLRGWWDHYLTDEQKTSILNHKKEIKREDGSSSSTGEEDAVYTLCLAILKNFVGSNIPVAEKITTLLQNLKCPSLTHFRWYKDTFLTRVMQLRHPNDVHWKSKFIDGLPSLFAEKVRNSLRIQNDGININYENKIF